MYLRKGNFTLISDRIKIARFNLCRYYRSGVEMVRMANTYLNEGSLENAYVLYMKYMTLFIEKIRKHPDFASVPSGLKAANTNQLREILPKTEKLKAQLLEQYKHEYNAFLEEKVSVSTLFIFFLFIDIYISEMLEKAGEAASRT